MKKPDDKARLKHMLDAALDARKFLGKATFEDELRHYADMKISLDLDDGVKVNYGRFGNLLAEKKAVTGKK